MVEPSVLKQFGRRLKLAREQAGLSQEALAELLGVSPRMVTHYEAGSKAPQFERLPAIGEAVQKPIPWFFEDTPGITSTPEQLLEQLLLLHAKVDTLAQQVEILLAKPESPQHHSSGRVTTPFATVMASRRPRSLPSRRGAVL